jgi:hypothetical protein
LPLEPLTTCRCHPPYFDAHYGDHQALIAIDTLDVIAGKLPKRVKALVVEWVLENKEQSLIDWQLAKLHHPLINKS